VSSRVIGETRSLAAFPCIGQLQYGHFLVIPKFHEETFRGAINHIDDLKEQFRSLIDHICSLLYFNEKEFLYFEHGAYCAENGGCGIYHAHIHVVPRAAQVNLKKNFPESEILSFTNIFDGLVRIPENNPYLMFGTSTNGFFGQVLEAPLPSQTLRRIVASEIGCQSWDWRNVGREMEMLDVLKKGGEL
jgi:diadenosine tetraphosphate (Ap4A) HIT family hydrolase